MSQRERSGSAILYDVAVERDVRVGMRDGVRLAADVYRPALGGRAVPGRFPALVERTPYDKRRPVLHQTGHFFARRGYVFASQDVRGRHGSEGEWSFLSAQEGPDGYDTLAWICDQPWCDGKIGTLGLSYSTATQQALAVLDPPGLASQVLSDGGYDYFHRTLRHSGAFELAVLLPHALRLAREGRELARDPEARAAFERELLELPQLLERLKTEPPRPGTTPLRHAPSEERWFLELLTRSRRDAFWQQPTLDLGPWLDQYKDVPILLQTSWYGHHVWATLEKFRELRRRHRTRKQLLIGHWTHGYDDYARSFCGEVDFGVDAMLDSLNDLRLRWFDATLKGLETGILEEPSARIFVMGGGSGARNIEGRLEHGGRWVSGENWPPIATAPLTLYLHAEGRLRESRPSAGEDRREFAFDPRDPVPSIGGGVQNPHFPGIIQGGPFDQRGRKDLWACRDLRPLAEREDVLVFETEPLTEGICVVGPVRVELFVSSSAPDTDFTAKLIDVYPPSAAWPEAFAMNLTDGIARARYRGGFERDEPLVPGEVVRLVLELQATANVFAPGHRMRLDLSSSSFPRFDVNPNTGEPLGRHTRVEVARNAVHLDAERPSHVVLPVAAAALPPLP